MHFVPPSDIKTMQYGGEAMSIEKEFMLSKNDLPKQCSSPFPFSVFFFLTSSSQTEFLLPQEMNPWQVFECLELMKLLVRFSVMESLCKDCVLQLGQDWHSTICSSCG